MLRTAPESEDNKDGIEDSKDYLYAVFACSFTPPFNDGTSVRPRRRHAAQKYNMCCKNNNKKL